MPKRTDISKVLVIGSGPIVIGQACEFDYSGTQAIKALKEEGYKVVLVNSNPATIMTDPGLADRTYIEPITADFVEKIIERERPDVLLPTLGGQTGLNTTLELAERGVLERYGVELIGASVQAIKMAEDRQSFKDAVSACGLESARSHVVRTMEEAQRALEKIGLPLIIRPSRTLGGSGGSIVTKLSEFEEKVIFGFYTSPIHELLLEESLIGWKEVELEVMRDRANNAVIVCSIENLDPMGLHTGDSVTVAPIQTLTDKEYQCIRNGALALMKQIGVDTGGSNVQFAVDPKTGRIVVIELNPRVSRSSALASKATGFPIAKIAAKLAIGYTLDELPNDITKKTPACFEPSIDYVVVKIPRFNFEKFAGADRTLGTQMKSVGEVMAIGRTFPEALQKACRSLESGRVGLLGGPESKEGDVDKLLQQIAILNPERMFQIARCLELGVSVEKIYQLSAYDPWFSGEMLKIVQIEEEIARHGRAGINQDFVRQAKRLGVSDARFGALLGISEEEMIDLRQSLGVRPAYKCVDTCAAEFSSYTPYLYSTYDEHPDSPPTEGKKVIILGSGPNRIGQGLEFDYCCVHAAFALHECGIESIMVNCNPETVSTDYDTSDRLYFEPLTLEDVIEIVEREKPWGVIVQYGGQTPLKLSLALQSRGTPIIGTSAQAIELSEDREAFRELLQRLKLKQSKSDVARNEEEALKVAKEIKYPLLVRPSFVLGGRAMAIIHNDKELSSYIRESVLVSFERPVLLDRFLEYATEVDVDAVCDGKEVLICGIMEHVEQAGIHSGDSSFMMPSQTLSEKVLKEIEQASKALALESGVKGLMNVQYAVSAKQKVYVLEVNPRASRSVPFVSKVTGIPWAKVGLRVMAGEALGDIDASRVYGEILSYRDYQRAISKLEYVCVKESVFPFVKFFGVDTVLGPEMRSTGEVMGVDRDAAGGFARAQEAAGSKLPSSGSAFISVRDADKTMEIVDIVNRLQLIGFDIVATDGTAQYLSEQGVIVERINKVRQGSPHIVDALRARKITMVINTPEGSGPLLDSRSIRSTAVEFSIPLFTTMAAVKIATQAMGLLRSGQEQEVRSLQEYLGLQ